MNLIDTHVHLEQISKLPVIIDRCKKEGVLGIVAVGMDLRSNQSVLAISKNYPGYVFPALGLHPWSLKAEEKLEDCFDFIENHINECVAIGEIGLDYKIKIDKKFQQKAFQRILDIARWFEKPACIHSRYSYKRTYQMVRDAGIAKAVFHWYSGPLDCLESILEDGYFVSATPALEYSEAHRKAISKAPLEQILIETDAPVEYKGEKSRPFHIVKTLEELMDLKGVSAEAATRVTTESAIDFFGLSNLLGKQSPHSVT
jgi:TatD DNase family protein